MIGFDLFYNPFIPEETYALEKAHNDFIKKFNRGPQMFYLYRKDSTFTHDVFAYFLGVPVFLYGEHKQGVVPDSVYALDEVMPYNSAIRISYASHKEHCFHELKDYTGLFEVYQYCTRCDQKFR